MTPLHSPQTHYAIDRLARRRAGSKLGWYIHALVYISVNLMLALLSLASGEHWAMYPAMGWGLGLLIHALVVFFATGGAGLYERLIKLERERLDAKRDNPAAQQDPW